MAFNLAWCRRESGVGVIEWTWEGCVKKGWLTREMAETWHRKSPGQKSERAGFPKVLELFLTSATNIHITTTIQITMKRKLNDQDVPEVAETVTDVEAEAEEKVEKKTSTAKTFAELGLDARLLQAINKEKFAAPTPVQARAIPLALSGKDILGNSSSGSTT